MGAQAGQPSDQMNGMIRVRHFYTMIIQLNTFQQQKTVKNSLLFGYKQHGINKKNIHTRFDIIHNIYDCYTPCLPIVGRQDQQQPKNKKLAAMKKNNLIAITAIAAVVSLTSIPSALAAGKSAAAKAAKPGTSTIVSIVLADDGEFDVLQAAVVKAGLVDVLNGRDQYTVFAPTDDAFVTTLGVADEAAAIEAVKALPTDVLTDILLYHVTAGRRISTSVLAAPQYRMLNGDLLTRDELAAGIVATDISASNGVIHVINQVLLPKP
jgi:uncharacterized surface protein with fasciclin (FAS1) repeats